MSTCRDGKLLGLHVTGGCTCNWQQLLSQGKICVIENDFALVWLLVGSIVREVYCWRGEPSQVGQRGMCGERGAVIFGDDGIYVLVVLELWLQFLYSAVVL